MNKFEGMNPYSGIDPFSGITDLITGIWTGINQTRALKNQEEQMESSDALARKQLQILEDSNKANQQLAQQNIDWQKEAANNNLALQQSQFDYQKRLNEIQMQREDTAMQRQIADLQAAGFSPLMASGGSPSSALSSAPAPQLDVSGVSVAQGSYLQLAQQYAALKNETINNRLSRKQQYQSNIANNRQAAAFSLAQLIRGVNQDINSRYWQAQNFRVNAEHVEKQNQLIDEQIEASKSQRKWNTEHGYRNEGLENYLLAVLQNISSPKEIADKIKDVAGDKLDEVKEIIDNSVKIPEKIKQKAEQIINKEEQKKNFNQQFKKDYLLHYDLQFTRKKYYNENADIFKKFGISQNEFLNLSHSQIIEFRKDEQKFLRNYQAAKYKR